MELKRQKNVATIITFPILNISGIPVSSAAGLDSEIDSWSDTVVPDGFTDCTNEATEIGSTGIYYLSLTQAEMNDDYHYITTKSTSPNSLDQHILIQTMVGDPLDVATHVNGEVLNITSLSGTVNDILDDTNEIQGKLPTNYIMGSSDQTNKDDEIDNINTTTVYTSGIVGKLNITDSGNIGIDWANVENPSTSVNLSSTTTNLVNTTTTNSDMRGTDLAATSIQVNSLSGVVDRVEEDTNEIQGKLPTNYMMGSSDQTDKDDEIDNIQNHVISNSGVINALNNISTTEVNTEVTNALNTYDPPTRTEATTDKDEIIVQVNVNETKIDSISGVINALNDISTTEINTEVTNALNTYDPPTRTEATSDKDEIIVQVNVNETKIDSISGVINALNNISTTEVNTEVTNALNTYDPPTRTEAASDKDEIIVQVNVNETKIDSISGIVIDLNDLSEAQVNAQVDLALTDIYLQKLFAEDYNPDSKPGVSTAILNELVQSDGGVSQYTANALELAPGGSGSGGDATITNQNTMITMLSGIATTTEYTSGIVGNLNDLSEAQVNTQVDNSIVTYGLDHLVSTSVTGTDIIDNSIIAKIASKSSTADWDSYNNVTDALEAIADASGGGASLTDILNVQSLIPYNIDLANTATVRLGLGLTNMLGDLPSPTEITPGTIAIDRKAIGGTSWSNIVNDVACQEVSGVVYYDEVFDSGTGYISGDSIRATFKNQKITVSATDYEITGSDGWVFQTHIRENVSGIVSTSETNIRGNDSDTLESLSDQLDTITAGTRTPVAKYNG